MIMILGIILPFVMITNLFAQELDFSQEDVKIFKDNAPIKVEQWKSLFEIDTQVSEIQNNVNSLFIFSDYNNNNKNSDNLKSNVNDKNDSNRSEMNLLKAKDNLYLGDYLTAKNIINIELKRLDSRNKNLLIWANKMLFEVNRKLGSHSEATFTCLKLLSYSSLENDWFDDKLKLSCSLEFYHEIKSAKKNYQEIKEKLSLWSHSSIVKKNSQSSPLISVVISLSMRALYPNKQFSIRFLEESLAHSKPGNENLNKAYLALALLKYEQKNEVEAFSLIRYLSGDNPEYEKKVKYFQMTDGGMQVARLCLARMHAANGNYLGAETWYRDVLLESKVSGNDLIKKEKNRVHWEYANILYTLKKYLQSAKEYKNAVQSYLLDKNFINENNYTLSNNFYRTSNITLAKILSKSSSKNFEAESQLIELLGYVKADLRFLTESKNASSKNMSENIQNLVALSSLALEYGLETKEAKYLYHFRDMTRNVKDELSKLKIDLVNSLNSADYIYTGMIETRSISSLNRLSIKLNKLKDVLINLDKIEIAIWTEEDSDHKNNSEKTRLELLRRLTAMDDEISKYRMKTNLEDKLYNPKLPGALFLVGKNINEMTAELASLQYLFESQDKKIPALSKVSNEYYDLLENSYSEYVRDNLNEEFMKLLIQNRIFQLSRGMLSKGTFEFQKRAKILESTFKDLYILHKKNRRDSNSISDTKFYEALDKSWNNAFAAYEYLSSTIKDINIKIKDERKEIIENVYQVYNSIIAQEESFLKMKENLSNEYVKISFELSQQIIPQVQRFEEYIKLALATHNKSVYDILEKRNDDILKSQNERNLWIKSLRDSLKWELMR